MNEQVTQDLEQAVTSVSTLLRKNELLEAARVLATLSPVLSRAPQILTLRNRLTRLYAAEIAEPLHSDDLPVVVEILLLMSSDHDVMPALSQALSKGIAHFATAQPETRSYAALPEVTDALIVLTSRKRVGQQLLVTCLDILERDGPRQMRSELLTNLTAKWREVSFEGVADDVLQRIYDIGQELSEQG